MKREGGSATQRRASALCKKNADAQHTLGKHLEAKNRADGTNKNRAHVAKLTRLYEGHEFHNRVMAGGVHTGNCHVALEAQSAGAPIAFRTEGVPVLSSVHKRFGQVVSGLMVLMHQASMTSVL